MQLATIATPQGTRLVGRSDTAIVDVSAAWSGSPNSVLDYLLVDKSTQQQVATIVQAAKATGIVETELAFLPPIPQPSKILCIGLNYRDHAIESGKAIPSEPVVFGKFTNTLVGHGAAIRLPRVSSKVDYEAELVVVVGKKGKHIPVEQAMQYVAGYTVGHDVSARDWQFKGEEKQWMTGKSFDTFAPTGPWFTPADAVADPHQLGIRLRLNGQTMQDSSTKELIFRIPELIAYLSQVFTLLPGDLIFTGTPPGVGAARKPPVFLKPGDVVEVEIDGLGLLRNPVVAED